MSKLGEFDLIAKYFAPLAGEGSFGFLDDAAVLQTNPGQSLVITQDAIAEGVHFFPDDPPAMIAQKAIRVNLSDLAAKGAKPISLSLSLGLGKQWDESWISKFSDGLREDCENFGINFTGGDTFSTGGGFVISATAIGEVPQGKYTSRLGAEPGDQVYVSGTIGDGALGLLARTETLKESSSADLEYLKNRYLLPQPRLECRGLIRKFATASMDISDGLVGDAEKLAKASGVRIEFLISKVPFSVAVERCFEHDSDYTKLALTGGDDYEILLCIPEKQCAEFESEANKLSFPFTRIGEVSNGHGVSVFDKTDSVMEFATTSFDHVGESN